MFYGVMRCVVELYDNNNMGGWFLQNVGVILSKWWCFFEKGEKCN